MALALNVMVFVPGVTVVLQGLVFAVACHSVMFASAMLFVGVELSVVPPHALNNNVEILFGTLISVKTAMTLHAKLPFPNVIPTGPVPFAAAVV